MRQIMRPLTMADEKPCYVLISDRDVKGSGHLSTRTFCTLACEFSSSRRQAATNGQRPWSQTQFCPSTRATLRLRSPGFAPRRTGPLAPRGRNDGQHSTVMQPRRLTDISRMTPIGWLPSVSGARPPRVRSGLPAPRPPCRSTFRQVSARETPNAEARDCVRRRRTRPVDGRWARCPANGGRAIDVYMKRLVKYPPSSSELSRFEHTGHHPYVSPSSFFLASKSAR